MKPTAVVILILVFPPAALAAEKHNEAERRAVTAIDATDRLPTPHYHRQPSDPAWLVTVVQFHGHLGPSVVAGARMGMIGLRVVEAKGYFDVE